MSVSKQEVLDIISTVGILGSNRACWNFGMSDVISRMKEDVLSGKLTVGRDKRWTARDPNAVVDLEVVDAQEIIHYQ